MNRDPASRAASVRMLLVAGWCLGLLAAAAALGLVSIGLAGRATGTDAPHGWEQLSEAFSVVNGVFSVFALVVVGITLWVQFNELRMQRAELRMQREATEQSQQELYRTSEAELRGLHMRLLELAINDPDLADVWTEYRPRLPQTRRKQYLYANLILAHFNMIGRVANRDEAYLRQILAEEFRNPIMQEFWETVRETRRDIRAPGSSERTFDDLCEAAYQEARDAALPN